MDFRILVVGEAESEADQMVATQIAKLLEVALSQSESIVQCNAIFKLAHFETGEKKAVVSGELSGIVNNLRFQFPAEYFYNEEKDSNLHLWLKSPIFAAFLYAFMYFINERDSQKREEKELHRALFETASKLEGKILKLINAPAEIGRREWRIVVLSAATGYLICAAMMFALTILRDDLFRHGEGSMMRCIVSVCVGMITAFPGGMGILFFGMLVLTRQGIEHTVFGQSLLRFVGVKSVASLRLLSILGTIVGFTIFLIIASFFYSKI